MRKVVNNEVAVFTNERFGNVRVVIRDASPWFGASDVAKALGYSDPNDAVRKHCKYAELLRTGDLPGLKLNPRGEVFIPESDVYALIFRSNLPAAEGFRCWVCEEVLPSIRKTGKYSAKVMIPDFDNPAEAARAWAAEYEAKQAALKTIVEQQETIEAQEIALGDNRDWKAVTAIPWLKDYFCDTSARTCARIGKTLAYLSRRYGMEIRKAEDDRWGTVNVYHTSIINMLQDILNADHTKLADIRK